MQILAVLPLHKLFISFLEGPMLDNSVCFLTILKSLLLSATSLSSLSTLTFCSVKEHLMKYGEKNCISYILLFNNNNIVTNLGT